ncbi:hypothetical protein [Streptomyces sp. NPDC055140]
MSERPTTAWREGIAEEQRELAAGTLDPECACMAELFPERLLVATDSVLGAFEAELPLLQGAPDEHIFAAVQRVVLALNVVNDEHNGGAYETGEREQLCHYIDEALTIPTPRSSAATDSAERSTNTHRSHRAAEYRAPTRPRQPLNFPA